MKKCVVALAVFIFFTPSFVMGRIPLAALYTPGNESVLYVPLKLVEAYRLGGGILSEQRSRHDRKEFVSGKSQENLIEALQSLEEGDPLSVIRLRDGNLFLIQSAVLARGGVAHDAQDAVPVDSHNMRMFIKMLLACPASTGDASRLTALRSSLVSGVYRGHHIRSLRRTGWALSADQWFDTACVQAREILAGDDESQSVSSSDTETMSALSLLSVSDHEGGRQLRTDIAWLLKERGADFVRERTTENVLNLHDCGLTSVHDFNLLKEVLGDEQWDRLEGIDLSRNPLFSLEGLSVPAAHTLDVSACRLAQIPDDLFRMLPHLRVMVATHNEIAHFPVIPADASLEMLSLHHNRLSEAPNCRAASHLEVLNLAYNQITTLRRSVMPEGGTLRALLVSNNQINRLESGFVAALPQQIVVDTQHNPLWQADNEAHLQEVLVEHGYEALPEHARTNGSIIAHQIRDTLFTDMRDKLCDYLLNHNLLTVPVVRDEIHARRSIGAIHTRGVDVGMWMYRYGGWLIAGAAIIGGGLGGIAGYVLKHAARSVVRRVLVGAGIGLTVGAVAGYFGYRAFYDPRHFYLSDGGDEVFMSSSLREKYIGTYRLIALLYLLKQYLIACNVCLYWVLHYDELMAEDNHIEDIMQRLEEQMHTRAQMLLARTDDATTIALIANLITEQPLTDLRRQCPDDLFPAADMRNQPLADRATFAFLGIEKLTLVRSTICRFADAARTLRAMLINRYIGTHDHARILSMVARVEPLQHSLALLDADVVVPTITGLEEAEHGDNEWTDELRHVQGILRQTHDALGQLMQQAERVARLAD